MHPEPASFSARAVDKRRFFVELLRRPREIGAILPSSRFLEHRLVRQASASTAKVIVELGPGTGGTTRALLASMPADGRLLAIELNPKFARSLRTIDDPRLVVCEGTAVDLHKFLKEHGLSRPNAVVSGIPFSTLPPPSAHAVMAAVYDTLAPDGRFVAYQIRNKVHSLGRTHFGRGQVQTELRNIPPVRVYTWTK